MVLFLWRFTVWWGWCEEPVQEAVSTQSFQARWPGRELLSFPPFSLFSPTCYPGLVGSCRLVSEKGVAFHATISDISELQGELPLCGTKMP